MADDDPIRIFILTIVGFFAGLCLFYMGFIWQKQKRLIENLPTSKIRSLAMGLVEVMGEVLLKKDALELKGPFSNKPCVYYRYLVEEYRKEGKNSRWVTISQGIEDIQFYLKDETGKVIVNPARAKIDIPPDNIITSEMGNSPPREVCDFIKSLNISHKGWLGINKKMRYTEWRISPGDKLYIIGTADDNPQVEEGTSQSNVDDIIITKGKNNPFYYISDRSEKEVLNSMKWKTIGGLFGGGALTVICFAAILLFLKYYFGLI